MDTVQRRRYQKRLKPSDRREAILDAAMSLITRTGDMRVTMASVAAEGGVTKPVVYDYFANAEALLVALLTREGIKQVAAMNEVLPDPASLPDVEDKLAVVLAQFEHFLRAVQENPGRWQLTVVPPEGAIPGVRVRVEMEREAVRQRIMRILEWAMADQAGEVDLDLMSHAIHAVGQRFARQLILEPDAYPPERVLAFLRNLLTVSRPVAT